MRHRAKVRAYIDEVKLAAGCLDCGYKEHSVALDFDHVRGVKEFNISQGYARRSWAALLREMDKCEVVCSNCHRVRTARRKAETQGKG